MTPSVHSAGGRRSGSVVTREKSIERIRRWNELFGEPPCAADWNPSVARWRAQEWRIERYRAGDPETGEPWPSLNAVKRRFEGSWDAAVRAAGLEPRRPGPARAARSATPDVEQRVELAPPEVQAADASFAERLRDAQARALRAERRTRKALRRAERADAAAADARARARRSADRARRALAARERMEERCAAAVAAAHLAADARVADAEARVHAAEDQMHAAIEHAAQVADTVDAFRHGTAPASVPAGPVVLAGALKRVAAARSTGGPVLRAALTEVAIAAISWRDRV